MPDQHSDTNTPPEMGENDPPETGTGTDQTHGDTPAPADETARLRAALSKANREAATNRRRLSEYEDRDKTDQQRAEERAQAAERRAADAERHLVRLDVALRKGLPATLASRLQGDTADELEADADALLDMVGRRRDEPRRDPDQGKGNGHVAAENDMNDWMRRASGVRAT